MRPARPWTFARRRTELLLQPCHRHVDQSIMGCKLRSRVSLPSVSLEEGRRGRRQERESGGDEHERQHALPAAASEQPQHVCSAPTVQIYTTLFVPAEEQRGMISNGRNYRQIGGTGRSAAVAAGAAARSALRFFRIALGARRLAALPSPSPSELLGCADRAHRDPEHSAGRPGAPPFMLATARRLQTISRQLPQGSRCAGGALVLAGPCWRPERFFWPRCLLRDQISTFRHAERMPRRSLCCRRLVRRLPPAPPAACCCQVATPRCRSSPFPAVPPGSSPWWACSCRRQQV